MAPESHHFIQIGNILLAANNINLYGLLEKGRAGRRTNYTTNTWVRAFMSRGMLV
ncbi:hypothetical protein M407DRAFT_32263 [Tulasnella calospora MUT 4182]|uniref:Uncharacterized protein n=1 Tax=Tulasnella calospora MUT 4182 TaxID=1051891 RepID=A0A0C3K9H9_9AGAM|nr:hypothetical protein M407DRAFT_32263 [Tulasnella calospora MUT 4182]